MMKKVMFVTAVLVSLVFVGTCLGLESAPSNKVGYTKFDVSLGTTGSPYAQPFGLAFKFWNVVSNVPQYGVESTKPSSIVGSQTNQGNSSTADRISRQGGDFAYRNTLGNWAGNLETTSGMINAEAYYYINKSGVARTLVLAGEADTTGVGINTKTITAPAAAGQNVSTSYSYRDPRVRNRAELNLLGSPYGSQFLGGSSSTSDRLSEQGGNFCYYSTSSSAWAGTLTGATPGKAYYIINKHVGNTWSYTYLADGGPISMPPGDRGIDKVTVPKTTTVKTKTSTK